MERQTFEKCVGDHMRCCRFIRRIYSVDEGGDRGVSL